MLQKFRRNLSHRFHVQQGFTLVELTLSIALMTLLVGMSLPVYQSFQTRNDLDIATHTVVLQMRHAQARSQAVDSDISWGVFVTSGSITLFQGANYVTRNIGFDETVEVPPNITMSGTQEFIYTKFTGHPVSTGTLTLTSATNETRSVTINTKGTLSY